MTDKDPRDLALEDIRAIADKAITESRDEPRSLERDARVMTLLLNAMMEIFYRAHR